MHPNHRMEDLGREVTALPLPSLEEVAAAQQSLAPRGGRAGAAMAMVYGTPQGRLAGGYRASLVARVHLRLGLWRWSITPAEELTEGVIEAVKGSLHIAIQAAPEWAKAWHHWALFNVNAMQHYGRSDVATAQRHVAPAVAAFFKSVALGQSSGSEAARGSNLQDILRLLTLWFSHGAAPDVEKALEEGFGHVSIDTWLVVIPQVILGGGAPYCCSSVS